MTIYDQYETVIGLETHIQLNTNSKAFCGDDTGFGAEANTHISAISLGHPGTLPKLNATQLQSAIKLGVALNCRINQNNFFDRKNYFYTDLPKGYQITQDNQPICIGGSFKVKVGDTYKEIRLHHIHMEEDAGKSIHDLAPKHSYIDLNRAGVPLLEIVTEPDFRSAEEVDAFMNGMRQLVRYLGISDGNMERGQMRCDVNVSVRKKGTTEYGERCEVKNLNSMRFARNAIKFERKRQIDLLESGGKVVQSTLNFNPSTGETTPLRTKENANDYRYFPDPDLPPMRLTDEQVATWSADVTNLPWELAERFTKTYGLTEYDVNILTEEKATALFYESLLEHTKNHKAAANLLINKVKPQVEEQGISYKDFGLSPKTLAELIQLIDDGKVSGSIAYQKLFPLLLASPTQSAQALAEQHDLIQSNDDNFLEDIAKQVIAQSPDKVKAYQNGKADPKKGNEILRKLLEG